MNLYKQDLDSFISALSRATLLLTMKEVAPIVKLDTEEFTILEQASHDQLKKKLYDWLSDEKNSFSLYHSLSSYELQVLKHFIFYVGEDLLTYRQMEQGMNGIQPHSFRLGLTALRRKGIIYTIRRQWGEVSYVLPNELESLFYPFIIREEGMIEPCAEEVSRTNSDIQPFIYDLFLLLNEFRLQPKTQFRLTQKGTIPKRTLRFWQEKWMEKEEALSPLTILYEHKDTYSNYCMLLLDFLTRKKLILWYENVVQLNITEADNWVILSRDQMMQEFFCYWCQLHVPTEPWLARYQKDLLQFHKGEWHYVLTPVELWEKYYTLPTIKEVLEQIKTELLTPLVTLGCIDRGTTANGEEVWRVRKYEETKTDLWLQPTTELYCPSIIGLSTLWKLTQIYTFTEWENMLVLRLSQNKVKRFIEGGGFITEWLAWLEQLTPTALPEGMQDRLQQWMKNEQQVYITDRTLIQIENLELANAMEQWLMEHNIDALRVDTSYFLIPLQQKDELMPLLSSKGIEMKMDEGEEQKEQIESPPPLITTMKKPFTYDKVESVFPDLSEAIPGWNRLPDLWKKHLNSYHEKTIHDMVLQAIENHLVVKVEDRSGKISIWSPIRCEIEHGHWVCYDQDQSKHLLEDIRKIQLLFPELNSSC